MEKTLFKENEYEKEKEDRLPDKKDGPVKVCFVCTGNTCRSPMAAALLNHLGKGRYTAFSAGLAANEGEPISREAVEALKKRGIEPSPGNEYDKHTARLLTNSMLDECDDAVAISQSHAFAMMRAFPFCISKITTFDRDIPDPYMRGQEEYEKCLASLEECIKERFLTEEE